MTAGALLPPSIAKELRAAVPLWAAAALPVVAAALVRDMRITTVALLGFIIGSVALGAHAIGHELSHRTLGVLLALPRERSRVLLTKIGVLTALQLALAALAWWALFRDAEVLRRIGWNDFPSPWLVSAAGLFVAPWLTMLCRNTMAAVVFTLAVNPALLVLGNVIGDLKYGDAAAQVDRLTFALHLWGTIVLCGIGAVAGWFEFMRLEVIEGRGREFHVPGWPAARTRRRTRHPLAALAGKELRMQGLTFVLFGLFVATAAVLAVTEDRARGVSSVFVPIAMLYTAGVSVLIGSLTVAEERQFATMDAQRLLPVAVWKHWAVKSGVAFALAVVLGLAVPLAVQALLFEPWEPWPRQWRAQALVVVLLTSTSLYLSSISASGVRAAVMSVPVVFGIVTLGSLVPTALSRVYGRGFTVRAGTVIPPHVQVNIRRLLEWSPIIFVASMSGLMLWLAYRNYRAGEWTPRRIALQLLGIASLIVLLMAAEFFAWIFILPT